MVRSSTTGSASVSGKPDGALEIRRGFPEACRRDAALLYDEAFGAKFKVAIPSAERRLDVLAPSFVPEFSFGAFQGERLVGLAGFQDATGSLTGGLGARRLFASLGFWRGAWATLVFSQFGRPLCSGELLMDGLAVASSTRGQGVGTRLLEALFGYAQAAGFDSVRLDVIDTNHRARALYERRGFVATKTERFEYLRWLLGFGSATTMIRSLGSGPDEQDHERQGSDPVRLRPYESRDLDVLLDVWDAATRVGHPFLSGEFLAQERRNIPAIYMPMAETWIAELEGRVVGFLTLLGSEVGALFVAPELHGRGIGHALMEHARELRGDLTVEVFERNAIGRAFYERQGFELVERKRHEPTGFELLRLALGAVESE